MGAMQLNLVPHPDALPSDPDLKVWVNVDHAGVLGATATTNLWFGVGAPAGRFVLPNIGVRKDRPEDPSDS